MSMTTHRRESLIRELSGVITDTLRTSIGASPVRIKKTLNSYSDDTLKLLRSLVPAARGLSQRQITLLRLVADGRSEAHFLAFDFFRQHLFERTIPYNLDALVMSLEVYPQFIGKIEVLPQLQESEREQMMAVLRVACIIENTVRVDGQRKGYPLLRYELPDSSLDRHEADLVPLLDAAVVDLVMNRPDEYEEIAHIMRERMTDDVEFILTVLDHHSPAVSEGVL